MSTTGGGTGGNFDDLDFNGRMSAVAALVRRRLAEQQAAGTPSASAIDLKAMTEAVRQEYYLDYSLWDTEFDHVARVVSRTLAEAAQGDG